MVTVASASIVSIVGAILAIIILIANAVYINGVITELQRPRNNLNLSLTGAQIIFWIDIILAVLMFIFLIYQLWIIFTTTEQRTEIKQKIVQPTTVYRPPPVVPVAGSAAPVINRPTTQMVVPAPTPMVNSDIVYNDQVNLVVPTNSQIQTTKNNITGQTLARLIITPDGKRILVTNPQSTISSKSATSSVINSTGAPLTDYRPIPEVGYISPRPTQGTPREIKLENQPYSYTGPIQVAPDSRVYTAPVPEDPAARPVSSSVYSSPPASSLPNPLFTPATSPPITETAPTSSLFGPVLGSAPAPVLSSTPVLGSTPAPALSSTLSSTLGSAPVLGSAPAPALSSTLSSAPAPSTSEFNPLFNQPPSALSSGLNLPTGMTVPTSNPMTLPLSSRPGLNLGAF